jgi:putative MATE family efflux protein
MDPLDAATPPATHRFWSDVRAALVGTHQDYTTGSVRRAILLLAIPMVLEMSMQSLFSVMDVFFVGRLGPGPVAVVGITDSLLALVFAIALGLSMGTTAMVARRIGEGDPGRAANAAVQAIGVGVLVAVAIGIGGVVFAGDLLRMMGADAELVRQGSGFTAIMLGGNVTVVLLFLINAVFRGAGDAVRAMRALWLANGINIVLDPILIFGLGPLPGIGLEGAAWATTIGRGLGVLYQLRALTQPGGRFQIRREHLVLLPAMMARLMRISAIGMLQFLIGTAAFVGLFRILSRFGPEALAGYTIGVRIIIFILLPAWGMGNAAATLVGQNLGAGRPDRAERSVWMTARYNSVFLGVVGLLLLLFAEPILRPFSDLDQVLEVGVSCLRIVSYSYVFWGFGMVTVLAFNGAGDTTTPTWINFFAGWALQIPLAWVLAVPLEWGPVGVFAAISVSQVAFAVMGVLLFRRGGWKHRTV